MTDRFDILTVPLSELDSRLFDFAINYDLDRTDERERSWRDLEGLFRKLCAVIIRELPVPLHLLEALQTLAGERGDPEARFWSWSRVSAWRIVKAVLEASDVHGDQA